MTPYSPNIGLEVLGELKMNGVSSSSSLVLVLVRSVLACGSLGHYDAMSVKFCWHSIWLAVILRDVNNTV